MVYFAFFHFIYQLYCNTAFLLLHRNKRSIVNDESLNSFSNYGYLIGEPHERLALSESASETTPSPMPNEFISIYLTP